ncbi:MAG: hypothetical protein D6781_10045 [Verrucomicrobia bacterium]|nr:MAG: hypothetical protein D6781_10045 [Verrucomicrobiota bacterium]
MKTKLHRCLRSFWELVSEVPGWPNAPTSRRIRRTLPVALPFIGILGVFAAQALVIEPARDQVRLQYDELRFLDSEIVRLRESCATGEADAVFARARDERARLFAAPEAIEPWLDTLAPTIRDLGWRASFHAYDSTLNETDPGAAIAYTPALGKLQALPDNPNRVVTLSHALEKITQSNKRIDLTRLVVRADIQGRPQVEINLRIPHLLADAQTAQ